MFESVLSLIGGFGNAITPINMFFCLIGVIVGMLVGIMPGFGTVAGTALLIPMTYSLEPVTAIIMLAGIYYGAMYGGTITSVLINTPGEAASVITCLDGHELAKQGRAGTALGVAAIGSFIGATISLILMTLISSFLVDVGLKFGPPETFLLMLFGITMLVGMLGKSVIKGLIGACFGFLLCFVGMDTVSGIIRFNFGSYELSRGFDIVTLCMGLFGISEVFKTLSEKGNNDKPLAIKKLMPEREEWPHVLKSIGRGSLIGFFMGLIPGVNAVVPTIFSYSCERRFSKHPEKFGHGSLEGVAGPETSNNSFAVSAMIPLLSLGIPTSATVAILYGAFLIHGLTPGPLLFQQNGEFVWTLIASFYIGNVILLILNLPLAKYWAKLIQIPFNLLFPFIIAFCVVGAFSANNNIFDVVMMIVFGLIGYLFNKAEIPLAPIILTFVLGDRMENSFIQSLSMSGGSLSIFFSRPICVALMIIIVLVLVFSIRSRMKETAA